MKAPHSAMFNDGYVNMLTAQQHYPIVERCCASQILLHTTLRPGGRLHCSVHLSHEDLRHRCPHDRNASSISLGSPDVHEYTKKEYAVAAPGERTLPIKRTGELSLYGHVGDDSVARTAHFEHNGLTNESKLSSIQLQTRITSAAVRRPRNDSSFGSDGANMADSANRSPNERLMAKRPRENALTLERVKQPRNGESSAHEETIEQRTQTAHEYVVNSGVKTEISSTQTTRGSKDTSKSEHYVTVEDANYETDASANESMKAARVCSYRLRLSGVGKGKVTYAFTQGNAAGILMWFFHGILKTSWEQRVLLVKDILIRLEIVMNRESQEILTYSQLVTASQRVLRKQLGARLSTRIIRKLIALALFQQH
ncbi:unnamed protein product [Toxocara canis]|uniref:CaMBD domain-containing protein n=1 Tax=Toxocara canis TaxID=6265 RepID=A0A183UFG8_TOXCA|nr:unnamed protein product [Toxocara canis]